MRYELVGLVATTQNECLSFRKVHAPFLVLAMFLILSSASACQVIGTAATSTAPAVNQAQSLGQSPTPIRASGHFDYFILALSWSPDYCASNSGDVQECALGRKLAFVLHGLWPEFDKGYPSSCTNEKLPPEVKTQFERLFPNDSLFAHEWEKHGTCTGLSPQLYFTLAKQIKDSVQIPDIFRAPQAPFRLSANQLKQQFTAANPGLGGSSLAVFCSGSGRFLSELYVCFSKDGNATACSTEIIKDASRSCQNADFLVRNIR